MSNASDQHALPSPPSRKKFNEKSLTHTLLPVGSVFFRIHPREHSPFFYREDPKYRFDSPSGSYGVMYVSQQRFGAFAETISRQFFDQGLTDRPVVFESRYVGRVLTRLESAEAMSLLDIVQGPTQANLGIDGRLMMNTDYSITQEWSERIHDHPAYFDGIHYLARHDSTTHSVAVFDRFDEGSFEIVEQESFEFGFPGDFVDYLDRCNYVLVPL